MHGDISDQGREYKEKTVSPCLGNAESEMPVYVQVVGTMGLKDKRK